MKNKWQLLLPLLLVVVTLLVYWFFTRESGSETESVRVTKGLFEITVTATGEIEALESTRIMIPDVLNDRSVRIRQLTITDLVKEGTVVEKGDYVALLDPADVEDRMRQSMDNLERLKTNLENALIDSSLVLSDSRDQIRVARDDVYDQEIKVEQSKFESKAQQRQTQISLDKAERNYEQKKRNYIQTRRKHLLNIQRRSDLLKQEEGVYNVLEQLKIDLRITAPSAGLVVYARRNNQKIKVGSSVSRWDPLIATLPDLSTLQSVVQIKEIDITKIKPQLDVRVKIDAFPNQEFKGKVVRIANVGQDVEGEFFNTFKVDIEVDPNDKLLLPGMTSTNRIVIESIPNAFMVPRMAVFSDDEFDFFVYKQEGLSVAKQQISVEGENDSYYKIGAGLVEKDRVMLHPPAKKREIKSVPL
ncbi:MAG TPA: HlyD family efflux transporter periplasmic adaptor subunit [Marinilabiliaceae bacterium]|nr:HlyD family efflux transporter periplasmic adaptor subunit [Marinilabiliaceae bacterium]